MDDETPDIPLENFGGETVVAAPPAAEPTDPKGEEGEQTTQPTEESGSEDKEQPKTENAEPESKDNSKPEEQSSNERPEKRDRLQNRFGELTGKLKEKDGYIEQLEAQIARNEAMSKVDPLRPNEEGSYDVEAIQKNQAQMAEAIATSKVQALEQRLERSDVASRMDAEGSQIEKTLADKGLSNPIHAENILAEIEEKVALAQYSPQALRQISPLKIAERYIRGIEAERRNAATTTGQNLKNLEAEQAVTPNAPAEQNLDEDAALEARLADIKF